MLLVCTVSFAQSPSPAESNKALPASTASDTVDELPGACKITISRTFPGKGFFGAEVIGEGAQRNPAASHISRTGSPPEQQS